MSSPVQSGPKQLCPYICVRGGAAAIEFYVKAFGAVETMRLVDPVDGRIGHAELAFGSTQLFLSDPYPEFGAVGPDEIGGSPVKLHLDVADADDFVAKAVAHGATVLRPVKTEFHGHRSGMVADPFGYHWFVAAKVEDVTEAEMQQRWSSSTTV